MTPPVAPQAGSAAQPPGRPLAVFSSAAVAPITLTKRSDFVQASRGLRHAAPGFHLQARQRAPEEAPGLRVGFTCSKKVGNAVARNRAKRRLRALARAVLPGHGRPGWDYVLVGRPEATACVPMAKMEADLIGALKRVHRG